MRQALLSVGAFLCCGSLAFAQTRPAPSTEHPILASAWAEAARAALDRETAAPDPPDQPSIETADTPQRTRLQLGVALKHTISPGSDTDSSITPTFVWRWRGKFSRADDRLSPAYRFSSFESVAHSQFSGRDFEVGRIKVRPLMIGLDYKMPRGKWNWAAGMSAGWAINDVEVPWQMRAIAETAGTPDLWVDVHNSLVWGPRLKGWYDYDRRLSFMVESAYLVTRPAFDVRANGLTTTRRLNADAFILKAGIVYGVY